MCFKNLKFVFWNIFVYKILLWPYTWLIYLQHFQTLLLSIIICTYEYIFIYINVKKQTYLERTYETYPAWYPPRTDGKNDNFIQRLSVIEMSFNPSRMLSQKYIHISRNIGGIFIRSSNINIYQHHINPYIYIPNLVDIYICPT